MIVEWGQIAFRILEHYQPQKSGKEKKTKKNCQITEVQTGSANW